MTLQIRSIILYNSRGETRQLDLQLGKVNYIAGGSETGKSAIIPIIEYCLGISEFNVPGEIIRRAVVCYAVLYDISGTNVFVAKRPPSDGHTRQYQAFYQENPPTVPPPLDGLTPNTNDTEVILRLGRLLNAEVGGTTSSDASNQFSSLVRTHYYLFQKSTTIANDLLLFHRQETHAEDIRESLPYHLGIIHQSDLELEQSIENTRKQIQRLRGRIGEERRRQRDLIERGISLALEAQGLGLITHEENFSEINDLDLLRRMLLNAIARWNPNMAPPGVEDTRMATLAEELRDLKQEYNRIQFTLESATELQREIAGYTELADEQRRRLHTINLFSLQNPLDFADVQNICPLCHSQLVDDQLHVPQITSIRRALTKLENDLVIARAEQPELSQQIQNIQNQLDQKQREVDRKQLEIASVLNETQAAQNIMQEVIQNNSRSDRLVGGIEFYLEISTTLSVNELVRQLEEKQRELSLLQESKQIEDLESRERRALNRLSDQMTKWAESLRISRQGRYLLDIERLTVLVDDDAQTYTMAEIGGDANFLKCHLVALLALHKHFAEQRQPIPGFIVLDRPAQVFFPSPDDYESLQTSPSDALQFRPGEAAAAQAMFGFLFSVADTMAGDLQIIILEHAFFDQPQFIQALVNGERWSDGNGLIPRSWIEDVPASFQQGNLL